jgi:hypothetical protein
MFPGVLQFIYDINDDNGIPNFAIGIIIFVVIIMVILVVMACVNGLRLKRKIEEKANEGKEKLISLLNKGEFKTEKSAISYTATFHRLYHKASQLPRPREAGIRSSCHFCEELLDTIAIHFDKENE